VLTLTLYQSLRVKGSTAFFLRPFLPLDSLLFLLPKHQPSERSRRGIGLQSRNRGMNQSRRAERTCQQPS
jgi:hypothetical protein